MNEICFYSGLPFWCSVCPELDDVDVCPNGVKKSDFVTTSKDLDND